ncbi:MAG: mechanosensitive ion channel family protein [Thermoplasmata archaeon]
MSLWQLVLGSVLIVAFFALVGEGASNLIRRAGKRAGAKESTLVGIRDATRTIWIVLAIVGVAYYADLASELSVLVVSTVGGLILSLALQATLSNVIAGLFMFEDGTLRVGDEITYSSVKGKVVRITLRTSWIMTEKGNIAVVSNSNLMGGPLTNYTATGRLVRKYQLEGAVPTQKPAEAVPEKGSESVSGGAIQEKPEPPLEKGGGKASVKRVKKGPQTVPPPGES